MLQSKARELLSLEGARQGLTYGWDYHRTARCKHLFSYGHDSAGVHRSRRHGSAFFTGLFTCGSVWVCPVCSAKVQERRRGELVKAIEWAYNLPNGQRPPYGYQRRLDARAQPVMVTFTFPHRAWNDLGELLDKQAEALKLLRSGSPWRRWVKASGYRGLIRSLELTHGRHGWHPHTHELWMVSPQFNASDRDPENPADNARVTMRDELLDFWRSACIRAGLLDPDDAKQIGHFNEHAVDVKEWCSASDYLAKYDDAGHWGVDREIAKASTKQGRRKGRHPFALLADAMEGDERAGRLFVEYATVLTERRKRQLFWSPGLKSTVGVADKTDEELAEESVDEADLLGSIPMEDWRIVRKHKALSAVLDAAEVGGWPAVEELIERLIVAEGDRIEREIAARFPTTPDPTPGHAAGVRQEAGDAGRLASRSGDRPSAARQVERHGGKEGRRLRPPTPPRSDASRRRGEPAAASG